MFSGAMAPENTQRSLVTGRGSPEALLGRCAGLSLGAAVSASAREPQSVLAPERANRPTRGRLAGRRGCCFCRRDMCAGRTSRACRLSAATRVKRSSAAIATWSLTWPTSSWAREDCSSTTLLTSDWTFSARLETLRICFSASRRLRFSWVSTLRRFCRTVVPALRWFLRASRSTRRTSRSRRVRVRLASVVALRRAVVPRRSARLRLRCQLGPVGLDLLLGAGAVGPGLDQLGDAVGDGQGDADGNVDGCLGGP